MSIHTVFILLLALVAAASTAAAYDPIPAGGDCTKRPNKCDKDLHCVGPSDRRRCKPLQKLGARCGQDPYWVCAKGLTCQYRCRISLNGFCTDDPNWCARGLHCVGTKHTKRCKKPVKVGGSCNVDPFWKCGSGLTCQHKKCRFTQGEECTDDPNWCAKGLKCVGSKYYKQCEKPVKLGGQCLIEPFWVCDKGLVCGKDNICRIKQGEECTKTPKQCAHGLHCVGTPYHKQCEKPVKAGGSCDFEPYWKCGKGLKCQSEVCRILKGADCTYNEEYCAYGLTCAGPKHSKKCVSLVKRGDKCTTEYDVCARGLVCGGLGKARICIPGMGEGRPCRIGNPKMQCEAGLKCNDGFCRYY